MLVISRRVADECNSESENMQTINKEP